MNIDQSKNGASGGMLEQIVTATSLLEGTTGYTSVPAASADPKQRAEQINQILRSSDFGEEDSVSDEDDEEEEAFEDGDLGDSFAEKQDQHESVAAVLTELSQATTTTTTTTTSNPSTSNTYINTTSNNNTSRPAHVNPNMASAISTINSYLQSHLNSISNSSSLQGPQKVRLSGPIRANINIRHGVWAPRLRCRKRKNLHAKDGIWIHPTCTIDQLIGLVRDVLPDEFDWDPQASPLRYQAVNDQSLQSLKTVSGTVSANQSLYSAFDLVRNRRSDGDNFILQLYVYGTWTIILKSPVPYNNNNNNMINNAGGVYYHDEDLSTSVQPPPKKKYQQAHYSQQQQQQLQQVNNSDESSSQGMFSHMRLVNTNHTNISSTNTNTATTNYYNHPLAANSPVTFLPTVTLEMKLNGTFVPVEVSRRSFVAAIRACSLPRTIPAQAVGKDDQPSAVIANNNSTTSASASASATTNTNTNTNNTPVTPYNITPPPSEA